MKELDCIFVVFGEMKADFSNIKSIETKVIPNIGESIVVNKQRWKVTDKVINYRNVENYSYEDEGRGGELCYIFVKLI